jgi:type IV pilus assembly protein PilM
MNLFNFRFNSVIGIEISSTAIKLVELSQIGTGFHVESYAIEILPENVVKDNKILKMDIVIDSIRRVVKRAKPRTKYTAIAVGGAAVFTKYIQMEQALSNEEIEIQVETECIQNNKPLEEMNLDFQILKSNNHIDVLIATCETNIVDDYSNAIKQAGLIPKIVDIDKFALANALQLVIETSPEINNNEIIGLIDIGATIMTINVFYGDKIFYTDKKLFGCQQLTKQIQNNYNYNYLEAELAQRYQNLPNDYYTDILETFKTNMTQQVSRIVQSYYSSHNSDKLSHLLITGGGSSIANIIKPIYTKVGGHVSIVNPMASMSIASRINKAALIKDAPTLMIACGLALRSFDEKLS